MSDGEQGNQDSWDWHYRTARQPALCGRCGSHSLCWDGAAERTASVMLDGQVVFVEAVLCRRVRCGQCHKRIQLRPPGLLPHKHFQMCVVASAVSSYLFDDEATQEKVAARHGCSRRTLGRWIGWVASIVEVAVLLMLLIQAAGDPVVPRLPRVRHIVSEMGRRAAQVLGLLEALAAALGLEPPGLRAVLERVIAGRTRIATYAKPLIPEFAQRPGADLRATLGM